MQHPEQGSTQRAPGASVAARPAAPAARQLDAGAPASELVRTYAADATPRAPAADVTMGPLFLRIDVPHELPIVVEDGRGRAIARFARTGDAAIFAARDHQSLPAEFLLRFRDEVGGL